MEIMVRPNVDENQNQGRGSLLGPILYLDDDASYVEVFTDYLSRAGYEVASTTSIPEAIKLYKERYFRTVLLDIMMPPTPDMNAAVLDYGRFTGFEVARRLGRFKLGHEAPLIYAFTEITDTKVLHRIDRSRCFAGRFAKLQAHQLPDFASRLLAAQRTHYQ